MLLRNSNTKPWANIPTQLRVCCSLEDSPSLSAPTHGHGKGSRAVCGYVRDVACTKSEAFGNQDLEIYCRSSKSTHTSSFDTLDTLLRCLHYFEFQCREDNLCSSRPVTNACPSVSVKLQHDYGSDLAMVFVCKTETTRTKI